MAAIRHLGFSKSWFLSNGSSRSGDFLSGYQIWCENVDRRRNYGRKSKSKMAAVRHLGFSKIWFLTTGTPWAADFPPRYKIWCKNVDRRRHYGRKSKSKKAAVRHLGFVTSSYRTTHEVSLFGHIVSSNFMLIRCIVLKIWRFEILADLAWNAYSRPQNFGFWGVWTPKRDWSSSRPPKWHLLGRSRTYMPILVQIGRLVRPVRKPK